jgi:hypothetical protein
MTSLLQAFSRQSLSELAFAGGFCRDAGAARGVSAQDREDAEYQFVVSGMVALLAGSVTVALFALAHAF